MLGQLINIKFNKKSNSFTNLFLHSEKLVLVTKAGRKIRIFPKPKIRAKFDDNKNLILPEKVAGYKPYDLDQLKRRVERAAKTDLEEKDRKSLAQKSIDEFVAQKWGTNMSEIRNKAKKRKDLTRRKRYFELLDKNLKEWNDLQDAKENRIIRHRERESREKEGKLFSFKQFLREYRERKSPTQILTDEEFLKVLEEDTKKYLSKGNRKPKTTGKENYNVLLYRNVIQPWMYEMRRKARIGELVRKHEDSLKERKYREEVEKLRAIREEEKSKERNERNKYWEKTFGEWHQQNMKLIELKSNFRVVREETLAKSRKDFLLAMEEDIDKWVETPNECKFLRFKFADGVKFPPNKSQ